jgi:hypothetical protein
MVRVGAHTVLITSLPDPLADDRALRARVGELRL